MQTHEIRMHDAEGRVAGMTQLAHTEKCSKYKTFVEYVVEGRRYAKNVKIYEVTTMTKKKGQGHARRNRYEHKCQKMQIMLRYLLQR